MASLVNYISNIKEEIIPIHTILPGNWTGENILLFILWGWPCPNTKTRQSHYKQRKQTNIPHEPGKILNKISAK